LFFGEFEVQEGLRTIAIDSIGIEKPIVSGGSRIAEAAGEALVKKDGFRG
jgi:hypothetical protein